MHRDIQNVEGWKRDAEVKTQIHTHSCEERAERRPRTKNKRNAFSLDTTYSCTRCALNNSKKFHFHRSHDVTGTPRDMQTCGSTPRSLGPTVPMWKDLSIRDTSLKFPPTTFYEGFSNSGCPERLTTQGYIFVLARKMPRKDTAS